MVGREGRNIKRIREAVAEGALIEPFSPADIKRFLGITYAHSFLAHYRVGNLKGNKERFIQISHQPALFRLAPKVAIPRKSIGKGAGL
jgi:hypothetical protein